MRGIRTAWIAPFLLAALLCAARAAPAAERLRVAVLSDSTNSAINGLADRLGADLSSSPEVTLVERQEVQRLLEERGLFAQAGADSLLAAGQLLGADVLASLRAGPGYVNCRVVDVRRGWVHASSSHAWPGDAAAVYADLRTRLRSALALALRQAPDLHPIAVLPFLNEDVDHAYDRLQDDLPALVEEALLRMGVFVPLDRSSLIDLAEERALAGTDGHLAGTAQILSGRFSTRRAAGQTTITLTLQAGSESRAPLWEGEAGLGQLVSLVGQAIQASIPKLRQGAGAGAPSPTGEAGALHERSALFSQQGDVCRALEMLEAALLLCPTQAAWRADLRRCRSDFAMAGVQPGEPPRQAERRVNAFIQCVDEVRQSYGRPRGQRPDLPQTWVESATVSRYAGHAACVDAWMRWAEARLDELQGALAEDKARPQEGPGAGSMTSTASTNAATAYGDKLLSCARDFLSMRPTPRQLAFFFPRLLARQQALEDLPEPRRYTMNGLFETMSWDGGVSEDKPLYVTFMDAFARGTHLPLAARLASLHGAVLMKRQRRPGSPTHSTDFQFDESAKRLDRYLGALVAGPAAAPPVGLAESMTLNGLLMGSSDFTRACQGAMASFAEALGKQGALSPAAESLLARQFRTTNGLARPAAVPWDDALLVYLAAHRDDRAFVDLTLAIHAARPNAEKFAAFARQNDFAWPPGSTWPPPATVAATAAPPPPTPSGATQRLSSELLTDFASYRMSGPASQHLQPLALLRQGDQLHLLGVTGDRTVWAGRYDPASRDWRWLEPVGAPFNIPNLAAISRETGVDEVDISISDDGIYFCRPGSGLLRLGFDGFSSVITATEGVPPGAAHCLGFSGRVAYVGCAGGVARWVRETKSWEVLFSARRAADENPLNGGGAYVVRDMEVDEAHHRLVFVVEGDRAGLWSYDLATRRCAQLLPYSARRPLRDGDWLLLPDQRSFVAYNLRDPALSRGLGTTLPAPMRNFGEPNQFGLLRYPAAVLGRDIYYGRGGTELECWEENGEPHRCPSTEALGYTALISWKGGLAAIRGQSVVFHAVPGGPALAAPEKAGALAASSARGRRILRCDPVATAVQVKMPFIDDDELGVGLEERSVKQSWSDVTDILACGPGLDVYWCQDRIYLMRQKDLLEGRKPPVAGGISDVTWDGERIWLATRGGGLVVLDADGRTRCVVGAASGLPPGDQGICLRAVQPGRVVAVGAGGAPARAWCAEVVTPTAGPPAVNVFHQAARAPSVDADGRSADLLFSPAWMLAVEDGPGRPPQKMLVGRRMETTRGQSRPLLIDVSTRRVSVLDHEFAAPRTRTSPTYISARGAIVQADDPSGVKLLRLSESGAVERPITVSPADGGGGTLRPDRQAAGLSLCTLDRMRLLGGDGGRYIYVPGNPWHRIDTQDWQAERLDLEPSSVDLKADWQVWMTRHYGLIGIANGRLHRLTLEGAGRRAD